MRVLAVCESPPTTDARYGNGSTLIAARLLPSLPASIELDVAYFNDRPAAPDAAVLLRAQRISPLSIHGGRTALLAQPVTRLPRGSWQRAHAAGVVRELARAADVVYLHGLHTFPLAAGLDRPCVVHEVDPWSLYWQTRAGTRSGWRRWYDGSQARRAAALEMQIARRAQGYVVVNPDDAAELGTRLGRPVEAIPNGIERPARSTDSGRTVCADLIGFVGTLDYPPNVEAVRTLCIEVMPRLRRLVPGASLVIAGRRPVEEVQRFATDDIAVVGEVTDTSEVFRQLAVTVYPTTTGRGTKNTVREALAAGCPVIASPAAASGFTSHDGLLVAADVEETALLVAELLTKPERRAAASRAATANARGLPTWSQAAHHLATLLEGAVEPGAEDDEEEATAG